MNRWFIIFMGFIYEVATFCNSASDEPSNLCTYIVIRLERWFGTNRRFRQWFVTIENHCHCTGSNGCLFQIHCHSIDTNSCFLTIKTIGSKGSFGQQLATIENHCHSIVANGCFSKTIDNSSS